MKKDIDYNEIIDRIIYYRDKANLSRREASLRLGFNEQYFKGLEQQDFELKTTNLLKVLELLGTNLFDFVLLGKNDNNMNKEFLDLFVNLSEENKQRIIDLMKNLK